MTDTALAERRELAHRTSDGIEVTLFWSKPSKRVTIAVLDTRSGEALEFEAEGSVALDAFNHPYAYAAAQGVLQRPPAARRGGLVNKRANQTPTTDPPIRHQEGAVMYSPHLYSSLVNARIDELHRSMAASRGRRSAATSHVDRRARQPRPGAPTNSIRTRFAH